MDANGREVKGSQTGSSLPLWANQGESNLVKPSEGWKDEDEERRMGMVEASPAKTGQNRPKPEEGFAWTKKGC